MIFGQVCDFPCLKEKILNNQVGECLPCRSVIVATKVRGVCASTEEILLNGMGIFLVSVGSHIWEDPPPPYIKWRKRKSESKELMYQEKPKSSVKERKRHLRKISVHNGTGVLNCTVEKAY